MTPRHRTFLLASVLLLAVILAAMAGYRIRYSMNPARSFEVAGSPSAPDVLIATQGSAFKDAVVSAVVERLKRSHAHVKVIDVSALGDVDVDRWSAVVVIHTWEMRKPPPAVKAFVDRVGKRPNLVVVTTSGRGDFRIEGVDAISAASRMEDVEARAAAIAARVDAILMPAGEGGSQPQS